MTIGVVYFFIQAARRSIMIGVNTMKKILSVIFCLLMIAVTAVPAFADDATVINEVRLSITEPVVGEAPDKNIVSAEPDKYTATVRYWLKKQYPNDPVEVFEGGYAYGVVFEITPAPGYTFTAVEKNEYNFNESPAVVYMNGEKTHCVASETDTRLVRAYDVTLPAVEPEKPVSFFQRIIHAVKDFLTKIADFFKKLFGMQ